MKTEGIKTINDVLILLRFHTLFYGGIIMLLEIITQRQGR